MFNKLNLIKSKKIRASAKGKDCTVRMIGVCNFNPETTVLAHIGSFGGRGMKCGDNMAVYACSACHAAIGDHPSPETAVDLIRALEETQQQLIAEGLLKYE